MKKIFLIITVVLLIGISLFFGLKKHFVPKVKDLNCVLEYPGTEDRDEFIFKFNDKGIIKQYIQKQITVYSTEAETQKGYEMYKESLSNIDETVQVEYNDVQVKKEGNSVAVYFYYDILESDFNYNKNREEIKKIYSEGYAYVCEE